MKAIHQYKERRCLHNILMKEGDIIKNHIHSQAKGNYNSRVHNTIAIELEKRSTLGKIRKLSFIV